MAYVRILLGVLLAAAGVPALAQADAPREEQAAQAGTDRPPADKPTPSRAEIIRNLIRDVSNAVEAGQPRPEPMAEPLPPASTGAVVPATETGSANSSGTAVESAATGTVPPRPRGPVQAAPRAPVAPNYDAPRAQPPTLSPTLPVAVASEPAPSVANTPAAANEGELPGIIPAEAAQKEQSSVPPVGRLLLLALSALAAAAAARKFLGRGNGLAGSTTAVSVGCRFDPDVGTAALSGLGLGAPSVAVRARLDD